MNGKLHVPSASRTQILGDIFGKSDSSTYTCGIGDAESANQFDKHLEEVKQHWDKLAPGFYAWFIQNHANDFKEHMISPIRRQAGITAPEVKFTNNANESLNKVVPHFVVIERGTVRCDSDCP